MKYKHYFFGGAVLLVSLAVATLYASPTFSQSSPCLNYQVTTNKAAYVKSEDVRIHYQCTNPSGGTVSRLAFEIVTPDNEIDPGTIIASSSTSVGNVEMGLHEGGRGTTYYDTEGTYTANACVGKCHDTDEGDATVGPKYSATFQMVFAENAIQCPNGFASITPLTCTYNDTKATCPTGSPVLHVAYSGGSGKIWECKTSPDANTIKCSSATRGEYYVPVAQTCTSGDTAAVCPTGYTPSGAACTRNASQSSPAGDSTPTSDTTSTSTPAATYKTCDLTSKTLTTCNVATYDKSITGFSCYKITSASFETLISNACKNFKGTSTGGTGTTGTNVDAGAVSDNQTNSTRTTPLPEDNTTGAITPAATADLPSDTQGLNTYLKNRKGDLLDIARFFSQATNVKEAKEVQKLVRDNAKEIAQIETLLKNSKSPNDIASAQKKLEEVEKQLSKLEDRKSEIIIGQQCAGVHEKIASLEEILGKLKKAGAKKMEDGIKQLEEDIKILKTGTNEACEARDEFSLVALTPDLDAFEQTLQENATVVIQSKADEYVTGTTGALRRLADQADEAIEDIAICRRVAPMIAKVRNLADELEKAAEKSNAASIGKLVAEAKNTQAILGVGVLRCANERLEALDELSENPGTAIAVNLDAKTVALLEGVQAEAWLDSQMPGILEKIAEFTNISRDAPVRGINGLMALDPKSRNKILKAKEIFLKRALEIDATAEELDVAPETKGKLLQVASGLATTTFCGNVAKQLQKDMEKLTDGLKEHTIDEAEMLTAIANFQTLAAKNQEACYREKIVKFVDASPEQWYFRFVSKWLEGKDGVSRPNENVRITEIIPPVLKALGENVTERNCTIDQPLVGVPSWGSCWIKKAVAMGLKPSARLSFSDFATREQVADFVNQLAGEQLPVQGATNDIKIFKDIEICGDKKPAVSMMKANGIMTGLGGAGKNLWGCGKLLTRAELAAVIDRVNGVLFIPNE